MGQILVAGNQPDVVYKDPDEVRDYPIDWSRDLPPGVTITDSQFLPADPALIVETDSSEPTATGVRFSGGTPNTRTKVTNRATLSDGQIHDWTFIVVCRDR